MSSANWEIRFSNSRQLPYFYNASTGTSTWERPDDVPEDEVASLPGAQYLQIGNSGAPDKVRASHLLVKHRDSRRPSSWKEVSFDIVFLFCAGLTSIILSFQKSNITRSVEEAEQILRAHAQTLGGKPTGDEFAALAKVHSDCSSASKGGDLGHFGRGQMQKPFEDAAFGLQVGQMSDVIKSDSGLHLILRTA